MPNRLANAEQLAEQLQKRNDTLVDLLNAIMLRDGGRIVIAAEYARAAIRRPLSLSWAPGMTHLVVHPDGEAAIPLRQPSIRERLHLPGR